MHPGAFLGPWLYMALLGPDKELVLRVFLSESFSVSAGATVLAKSSKVI